MKKLLLVGLVVFGFTAVSLFGVCSSCTASEGEEGKSILNELAERITIGGVVEVEAGYGTVEFQEEVDGEDSEDGSGIATATAELDIAVELAEKVEGSLILLWEEEEDGEEGIVIDEAFIVLGDFAGVSVMGGRYYPQFGVFNSYFVSDPLTLELGETQQSGVEVSYAYKEYVEAGVGIFNGDIEKEDDDDHIDDVYVYVNGTPVEGVTVGFSVLSDIADTDADVTGKTGVGLVDSAPAGFSIYASIEPGTFGIPVGFEVEFLGAMGSFDEDDLDADMDEDGESDGDGDAPAAWNIEVAAPLLDDKLTVAGRVAGTLEWYDMPELQIGVVGAYEIFDNTTVALEFQHNEYDEDWSENDNAQVVTAQLAIEF